MKLILPIFLSIVMLSLSVERVQGREVYKWTDEDGVVHYGSAPPPSVIKNNEVEAVQSISPAGSDEHSGSGHRRLRGDWYMKLDRRNTRRLSFDYDEFKIEDIFYASSNIGRRRVALGPYKVKGRAIELLYFEHEKKPEKLDQTEILEVLSVSSDSLRLLLPDGQRWLMKRLVKATPTQFSTDIRGRWQDDRGTLYDFSHGTFQVRKPYAQSGNWVWQDPELVLDFIVDMNTPIDHHAGRQVRWNLRSRSYEVMEVVDVHNTRTFKLTRVR